MLQTIVIDARAHMLGRLASVVAKQILSGYQIVSTYSGRGWASAGVSCFWKYWICLFATCSCSHVAAGGNRSSSSTTCNSRTTGSKARQLGPHQRSHPAQTGAYACLTYGLFWCCRWWCVARRSASLVALCARSPSMSASCARSTTPTPQGLVLGTTVHPPASSGGPCAGEQTAPTAAATVQPLGVKQAAIQWQWDSSRAEKSASSISAA